MIYFIQDTSVLNIKIGFTAGDAEKRLRELQTGSPCGLVVLATIPGEKALERTLHERFASARVHGEWFRPVPELIAEAKAVATAAGLEAVERWGWCFLWPVDGGAFVSRGGTWCECLERAGLLGSVLPDPPQEEVVARRSAGDLFSWAEEQGAS